MATIAETIYDSMAESLSNLYARWLDERAYEDIADYQAIVQPKIEFFGAKFLKMTKKPFGFVCQVEGKTYQFKITARTYEYKRVA